MAILIQDAGTLRTITGMRVKQSGITRTILEIKVKSGDGVLRTIATFAPPMTASASPTLVTGTQSSGGAIEVNTSFTTATPSGGLAPYTYSWTRLSGVGSANSSSNATTNFGASVEPGTEFGTFRVTITDSVGQTATANVTASFENLGGGGTPE